MTEHYEEELDIWNEQEQLAHELTLEEVDGFHETDSLATLDRALYYQQIGSQKIIRTLS